MTQKKPADDCKQTVLTTVTNDQTPGLPLTLSVSSYLIASLEFGVRGSTTVNRKTVALVMETFIQEHFVVCLSGVHPRETNDWLTSGRPSQPRNGVCKSDNVPSQTAR